MLLYGRVFHRELHIDHYGRLGSCVLRCGHGTRGSRMLLFSV